jgi:DNA-dependent RNA polymerase auxiliary subunit epsilon
MEISRQQQARRRICGDSYNIDIIDAISEIRLNAYKVQNMFKMKE